MRNTPNIYQDTLITYYNIIQAYGDMMNDGQKCYMPFLDYCFDIATMEFNGNMENHAAIEYKSPEAQVIIAAAETFKELVDRYLENDDEWNALFVISYGKASQKQVLTYNNKLYIMLVYKSQEVYYGRN